VRVDVCVCVHARIRIRATAARTSSGVCRARQALASVSKETYIK